MALLQDTWKTFSGWPLGLQWIIGSILFIFIVHPKLFCELYIVAPSQWMWSRILQYIQTCSDSITNQTITSYNKLLSTTSQFLNQLLFSGHPIIILLITTLLVWLLTSIKKDRVNKIIHATVTDLETTNKKLVIEQQKTEEYLRQKEADIAKEKEEHNTTVRIFLESKCPEQSGIQILPETKTAIHDCCKHKRILEKKVMDLRWENGTQKKTIKRDKEIIMDLQAGNVVREDMTEVKRYARLYTLEERRREECENKIGELEREMRALRETSDLQAGLLKKRDFGSKRVRAELDNARKAITDLEARLNLSQQVTKGLPKLLVDLAQATAEVRRLKVENAGLVVERDGYLNDVDELNEQLADLTDDDGRPLHVEDARRAREEVQRQQEELARKSGKELEQSTRIDHLEIEVTNLRAHNEELTKARVTERSEMLEQSNTHLSNNEELRQNIGELQRQLAEQAQRLEASVPDVEELERLRNERVQWHTEQRDLVAAQGAAREALDVRRAQFETERAQSQNEHNQLLQAHQQSQVELDELRSQIRQSEQNQQSASDSLRSQLEAQLADLLRTHISREAANQTHNEAVATLTETHQQELANLAATHNQELAKIAGSQQQATSELAVAHNQEVKDLKARHEQTLAGMNSAHNETLGGLQQQLEQANAATAAVQAHTDKVLRNARAEFEAQAKNSNNNQALQDLRVFLLTEGFPCEQDGIKAALQQIIRNGKSANFKRAILDTIHRTLENYRITSKDSQTGENLSMEQRVGYLCQEWFVLRQADLVRRSHQNKVITPSKQNVHSSGVREDVSEEMAREEAAREEASKGAPAGEDSSMDETAN